MAGTITHYWDGTKLVVTSDSGTSACDLKGAQGDIGVRGPQGVAGVGLYGPQGASGASIISTEFIGKDEQGGNIYEQTFDNGVKTQFTAPKGETGSTGASIVSTELIGMDNAGGNIYKQTFDNGATAQFTAPMGGQIQSLLTPYKVSVMIGSNLYTTVIVLPTLNPKSYKTPVTCVVSRSVENVSNLTATDIAFLTFIGTSGVALKRTGTITKNLTVSFAVEYDANS